MAHMCFYVFLVWAASRVVAGASERLEMVVRFVHIRSATLARLGGGNHTFVNSHTSITV